MEIKERLEIIESKLKELEEHQQKEMLNDCIKVTQNTKGYNWEVSIRGNSTSELNTKLEEACKLATDKVLKLCSEPRGD
jgi:hypothetical protein